LTTWAKNSSCRKNAVRVASRLRELRWATAVIVVTAWEREEQRAIREGIREEEGARMEIKRCLRNAAREKESLQRALDKAELMFAEANDDERMNYEEKLVQLQVNL
jgi:hypothetical protein